MFDPALRRLVEAPLAWTADALARRGVSANAVTLIGGAIGLAAVPALAAEAYATGLALILVNRVGDGLDGAIARRTAPTDFGGFLDIVADFLFYAGVAFGFALARPETNALAAAFVIWSFVGTGATFLAFAVLAAKRGVTPAEMAGRNLFNLGGLTEGGETMAFFVVICLLPDWFPGLAIGFGVLCWVTTVGRVLAARRAFPRGP